MTVSYACQVLSEPYETCMTSEHVVIATPSNVQVPENQPTMTAPKNPELKAMEKARIEKLFPKEMRRSLSDMQLYFGGIAALLQIIMVVVVPFDTIADLGAGLWCGLVIWIAGEIGVITTNSPSRRSIKALLVLSIFAAIFAQILIFFSWYGILEFRRRSFYDGVTVSWIPDSKIHLNNKYSTYNTSILGGKFRHPSPHWIS